MKRDEEALLEYIQIVDVYFEFQPLLSHHDT
jgi:hypothetical protein